MLSPIFAGQGAKGSTKSVAEKPLFCWKELLFFCDRLKNKLNVQSNLLKYKDKKKYIKTCKGKVLLLLLPTSKKPVLHISKCSLITTTSEGGIL